VAGISLISLIIHFMIDNLQIINKKRDAQSEYDKDFIPLVKNIDSHVAEPVTLIEKVIIARIITGDSSAFSTIFNAYYKDLVLFAGRITKDIDTAQEIVQDTFVSLWEDRGTINITLSLKSYLLKSVKNRCIDWFRHKKIVQKHNDFVSKRPLLLDYDTDSYVLYSELQEKLDSILDKLPDDIKEAYRMNRDKGLKYQEIAELLNVSVRAIEVRIGKALNLLRYHLREYFPVIFLLLLSAFL
jgi:RNA polymerase sigma-70 factor (ECF subfamily)